MPNTDARKEMTLRAEISYNQPFEISTPAEFVDVVETESLDFESQVDRYRFMSGGAHVFDKLYSVEMGALGNATFKMNIDQHTQHIYAAFAAGVQKNVLHGYSSLAGSDAVRWPGNDGMLNTYPERFSERQPSSIHYKEWSTMISRYQKMLQQGVPKVDFAILRTDYHADSLHRRAEALQTPAQYELGHYFRDLTMQQMGYTYDYFAPAILENTDAIEFQDGLLNPDTMGYQAVILYQEHIALESAEKLLEFARQGLPVVFVNGLSEVIECQSDTVYNTWQHGEAASKSMFTTATDEEVQQVIAKIKALPNSRTVDAAENGIDNDAYLALQELGVYPRAAFHEKSHNVVTSMRETDNEIYLYAYNHRWDQQDAYQVEITLDALGKPYHYDAYTGEAEPLSYTVKDGKTVFSLTIEPGDATMVVLDKAGAEELHVVSTTADKAYVENGLVYMTASRTGEYTATLSDGSTVARSITAPAELSLSCWNLTVEKWTADPGGIQEYASETRPEGWASDIIGADASQLLFGGTTSPAYTSTEYIWPTAKESIDVGTITDLVSWKEIPELGEFVSGIGYYETAFDLPDGWTSANGAVLDIGSISGQTAAVYVNGEKVGVLNPRDCTADLSGFLKAGKNTVKVEVTSILMNALRELYRPDGLYADFTTNGRYPGWSGAASSNNNQSRDFGMTGEVKLIPYTKALAPDSKLSLAMAYAGQLQEDGALNGVAPAVRAAFEDALRAAKALLGDLSATKAEMDGVFLNLSSAIMTLDWVPGDKTRLSNLVGLAKSTVETCGGLDCYTDTATYVAALADAEAVLTDENAGQEDVNRVDQALWDAFQNLKSQTDKTILHAVIQYARGQRDSEEFKDVIDLVQKSFAEALDNAEAAAGKASATQQEVDAAWQALMKEIHKLGFVKGNITGLEALAEAAQSYDLSLYVQAGQQEFKAALEAARKLIADKNNALEQEIQEVQAELLNAMMNLRLKADKSVLQAVLADADKVDTMHYTVESVDTFSVAYGEANAVNDNSEATQTEADNAAQTLRYEIGGLVRIDTMITGTKVQSDNTLNAGTGSAKTGENTPIPAALSLLMLAGAGCALFKKVK